jgi:hypothetical protein
MGVGCVRTEGATLPYHFSWRDADVDTRWMMTCLKPFGIERGSLIHITQSYSEFVQFWPIYEAARNLGAVYANGMATSFDAYRLEMYLRRFRLTAVIGITVPTLDGLQQGGHDIEKLFGGVPVLMALPDAAARLREFGFKVATLLKVGPFMAIEAAPGEGGRFDNREWSVDAIDGELHVTSAPARSEQFDRLAVGVKGSVERVTTPLGPEWRIFAETSV